MSPRTREKSIQLRFLIIVASIVWVFWFEPQTSAQKNLLSIRGIIYFSNNTPSNLSDFPVELLTKDQKSRVAETTPTETGHFFLKNLKPGKYLLRISNPGTCTLTYKVQLRNQSITNVRHGRRLRASEWQDCRPADEIMSDML